MPHPLPDWSRRVTALDAHTAGEPTRVILAGGPDLGAGSLVERRELFRTRFDGFRSAVINEPRGSDVMVGALLVPPNDPSCVTGVIFFNNVGTLGMCGHGAMGVIVALAAAGRIGPGRHRLETPVGIVECSFDGANGVEVANVLSYQHAAQVKVEVPGYGEVTGDIAWGGNWFFLVEAGELDLTLANVEALTAYTWAIRQALSAAGIRGGDAAEIDHIELFGPPSGPHADSRNFVLCPGKAYDRSPCGTGTSAKIACLASAQKLAEGQTWRQEGIVGGVFTGRFASASAGIYPIIAGSAHIIAETTLILDPRDPLARGIRR